MNTSGVPFDERGGALRGCLDLLAGRYPRFLFGGRVARGLLPVFHFHDVTRAELEPKLQYLSENGYRTVRSDDIAAHAAGTSVLPDRSVALCFDDAWRSLWTVAAPLLKQYGLTAIMYAIPARMTEASDCRPTTEGSGAAAIGSPFVTWSELRALHSAGTVDVQSHTDSHSMIFCSPTVRGFVTPTFTDTPLLNRPQLSPPPSLRFVTGSDLGAPLYPSRSRMSDAVRVTVSIDAHERCVRHVAELGGAAFFDRSGWQEELARIADSARPTDRETEAQQQRAIEAELDRSRSILNDRLGTQSVNHICLPWGVSSPRTAGMVARVGYRSAFANRMAGTHAVRRGDDLYWLKRLPNKYIFRLPGRGRALRG